MIFGLPLHPLVVHAVIVLVPLALLALFAVQFPSRWREAYIPLAVGLNILAAISALAAKVAGGQLAGLLGGAPDEHAKWGNYLVYAALLAGLMSVLWFVLLRRQTHTPVSESHDQTSSISANALDNRNTSRNHAEPAAVVRTVGWVAVTLTLAATIFTVLAGHSGAHSVWGHQVTATDTATPTVPATSTAPATGPAQTNDNQGVAPTAEQSKTAQDSAYTLEQVAEHNTTSSCWTVVNAVVYDLTDWISQHPGGASAIENLCGTDATDRFEKKHGNSDTAFQALQARRIGEINSDQ